MKQEADSEPCDIIEIKSPDEENNLKNEPNKRKESIKPASQHKRKGKYQMCCL